MMLQTTTNLTDPQQYIDLLHRDTDGFITLFRKLPGGKVHQHHFKREQITDAVLSKWVAKDTYISLNSFFRPKRGNSELRTIHNLYIDLDVYNTPFTAVQVLAALEVDHFGQSIPKPNIVLHSGRGLGLIWHIEAISGLAIERFNAIQKALYHTLKEFGADAQALDAARVFRLPASINSKSNEIVRYDVLHDFIYNINDIGREYFGIINNPVKKEKEKRKPRTKKPVRATFAFNGFTLCQSRLKDLETLVELREGKMCGHRERLLFLTRFYALKITGNQEAAIQKMRYLNGLFAVPLKEAEMLKATFSAVTYVEEGTGINISNLKLIEWFEITSDEQKQLSTIISKAEKRRRDTEKKRVQRRAAGAQTVAKYNAKRKRQLMRQAKRVQIVQATYPLFSIRELAERVELSKSHVANLLKMVACGLCEEVSTDVSSLVKREPATEIGEGSPVLSVIDTVSFSALFRWLVFESS